MKLAELQEWLNAHGASLVVDGQRGPATRSAIIETFRNTAAPAISFPQLKQFSERLNCSTRQLAAVAAVESNGGGWDAKGLLTALWERHYLWRRVKVAVPFLSDPKPGGYTVDADGDGINDSWEKLADAVMLYGDIAFECASFGKFQVMGAHWKALGYSSVLDMVWKLSQSEYEHYELLARYIECNGLLKALQQIGSHPSLCLAFARGYNGKGQRGYDKRIADAHRSMAA